MKKILISLICIFVLTGSALAQGSPNKLKTGITQYKKGNYVGCMQTMEEIVSKDPGNSLARYYLAISYTKAGKATLAKSEYQKVIALNPGSELAYYANLGLKRLSSVPDGTSSPPASSGSELPTITVPPQINSSGKPQEFLSDQAKNTLIEKNLNNVIDNINTNGTVDPEKFKKIENLNNKKSENNAPSQEEIVKAMQTLSQAGLNPGANPYQNVNPEMMQLNMMLGSMNGGNNTNNNNPMSMLPLMMMSQGDNKNMDPRMIEAMITGMIMPGMFSLTDNNNNNNN